MYGASFIRFNPFPYREMKVWEKRKGTEKYMRHRGVVDEEGQLVCPFRLSLEHRLIKLILTHHPVRCLTSLGMSVSHEISNPYPRILILSPVNKACLRFPLLSVSKKTLVPCTFIIDYCELLNVAYFKENYTLDTRRKLWNRKMERGLRGPLLTWY